MAEGWYAEIRELMGRFEHMIIVAEQCQDPEDEGDRLTVALERLRDVRDAVKERRRDQYQAPYRMCSHGIQIRKNCKRCGRVVN